MTVLNSITVAPTAPSRNDPENFRARADAYVDWQSAHMVPDINDIVATLNGAMPTLWLGTSSTSMAVGTGSKSFTVNESLLFFGVGTAVRISDTADPMNNYMNGVVTAYTGSTGAMTVSVSTSEGSGTLTSWSITPEVPIPLLGTVATYDITTSTISTTANQITKVGDYGFPNSLALPSSDVDLAVAAGSYYGYGGAHASASGGDNPFPLLNGSFQLIAGNAVSTAGYLSQIAIRYSATGVAAQMKFRSKAPTWSAWVEIYHTGNQRYTVITSNTTLVAHTPYLCNTNGGAFTATLPASPASGDWVKIIDMSGTFHTANLTVGRNGEKIMEIAEDLIADEQGAAFKLVYSGSTRGWRLG